jgi:hypothetical protein
MGRMKGERRRNGGLSELMANTVTTFGETPFDIEFGTADAARAALQTTFEGHSDPVAFHAVNIGRAKIETGLSLTLVLAGIRILDLEMTLFVYFKAIEE